MSSTLQTALCPCHSGIDYKACCGQYHGGQHAPTAEALMRSRYCAYALGLVDYLMNTTYRDHPEYRKNTKAWREDIKAYCESTQFTGLAILESLPGKTTSSVTFEAKLSQQGKSFAFSEKSHFVKIGQRWLYHSGQAQIS